MIKNYYLIITHTHDFYPHPHPRPTTCTHDPQPFTNSFGLELLFGCFVIVGYSFPEEQSRASNQGVFLIFTVFSGRRSLFSLPAPSPLPFTRPISSSLWEVSTWRFLEQIARSKKTHARQAGNGPAGQF